MKKFIVMLMGVVFCTGCYIPYPSIGQRTLQPYEQWDEVCTVKVDKKGKKTTDILKLLGYHTYDEAVHRDNLVVLNNEEN